MPMHSRSLTQFDFGENWEDFSGKALNSGKVQQAKTGEIFALPLSFVLNRHSLFPFTVPQIIQLGSANVPGSLNFDFGDAR